ncbi:transcription factor [Ganoderma sinense ZZ0214-1]|uniref:DNA polymerase kappa n=1 Tax=Ganoderma sinense ZZ0214-1 TaxID=1077348 RepID=A0A2G8SQ69_9APHY|nr:transcription factor [Ganoderma sinense ZZ0214-1]
MQLCFQRRMWQNEKRKDKDLTERIERITKYRDEVTNGVDLQKVEQGVDKLIAQMEAQRDLSQVVVHVDMDAFFANVELLDNPDLASKPFGVGGAVMSTASYEARKFGVRSGMPTYIAKKLCPDLVVVKSHYQRYNEMSNKVMTVCRRYDPNMSVVGITSYCDEHGMTPDECVSEMRQKIHEETMLTASAGIAPNRMLAKICSDRNKPNGQFKLDFEPQAIKAFMHDLSIRKVPGVGRVNERLLESIGIKTCGDIYTQRGVLSLMDKQFGLMFLLQSYLGIASNVVEPWQREEKKSIGSERQVTFHALSDTEKILAKLEEVAGELSADMTDGGWTGKTITLKYKLDTFQVCTRAKSLDKWLSTKQEDLFALGKELLKPELPLTLRLIGLRVTKLKDLKAEAESKARGIKRFFNATPSSPSKRRRIEHPQPDEQDEELPQLSQDGFATSMPGYQEDVEADDVAEDDVPEADETHAHRPPGSKSSKPDSSRPPNSAHAGSSRAKPSSTASTSTSAVPQKPQSKNEARASPAPLLECPICGKMLETDNQGLNEHVDFCLSKGAIKEAQASSLSSNSKSGAGLGHGAIVSGPSRKGHKPPSKKQRDKGGGHGHGEGLLRFRKLDPS